MVVTVVQMTNQMRDPLETGQKSVRDRSDIASKCDGRSDHLRILNRARPRPRSQPSDSRGRRWTKSVQRLLWLTRTPSRTNDSSNSSGE